MGEVESPSRRQLWLIRNNGCDKESSSDERLRDIIDSLPNPPGEGNVYEKAITKLNGFFLPKKNIDILVTRFWKRR